MYYIILLITLGCISTVLTIIETSVLACPRVKIDKKPITKYLKSVFTKLSFFISLIDISIQQIVNFILIEKISFSNIIAVSAVYTAITIYLDMLGKSIALMYPEYFCNYLGYIIFPIYYLLSPVINMLFLIIEYSIKILGLKKKTTLENLNSYKEEIRAIIQQANKMDRVNNEIQMIETIFQLKETSINTIIVPRNEFCKIEYCDNTQEMLSRLMNNCEYRSIVVEKEDEIIGYIDYYELLKDIAAKKVLSSMDDYIKEPVYILESSNIYKVIRDIKISGNHIYFVINEYGTVLGLLTARDLLDELIGAQYNEDLHITKTKDGIFIDGIQNIRVLNKYLNLDLPEKFLTISGLLINKLRRIPKENEKVVINDISFTVIKCTYNKVLSVLASHPIQKSLN